MKPLNTANLSDPLRVIDRAFAPSTFESAATKAILADPDADARVFGLDVGEALVAVILYSPVFSADERLGWALAPVAVDPDHQRQGHGTKLITESLLAPGIVESPVFVLGDPAYYERFGFRPSATAICPFDPSGEHFRVLRWPERAEPVTLKYHSAFQAP